MARWTTGRLLAATTLVVVGWAAVRVPRLRGATEPPPFHICPNRVTEVVDLGPTLVFTGTNGRASTVWGSDRTPDGTVELHAGRGDYSGADLHTVAGRAVFTYTPHDGDYVRSLELWGTNGTKNGTHRLAVLTQGTDERFKVQVATLGERLVVALVRGVHGLRGALQRRGRISHCLPPAATCGAAARTTRP